MEPKTDSFEKKLINHIQIDQGKNEMSHKL